MTRSVDQELTYKILENEGLDYSILWYFGRDLDSDNPRLNELWALAFDTLQEITEILRAADEA